MSLDPAWIALIGTLCGSVGMKVIEHWLGRSKVRVDEASKIRDEQRALLASQREEIKALDAQVDKWRTDYYNLRDEFAEAKAAYTAQLQELKNQLDATQKAIETGPPS